MRNRIFVLALSITVLFSLPVNKLKPGADGALSGNFTLFIIIKVLKLKNFQKKTLLYKVWPISVSVVLN